MPDHSSVATIALEFLPQALINAITLSAALVGVECRSISAWTRMEGEEEAIGQTLDANKAEKRLKAAQ